MVFVHSRKGTGETARALTERATLKGEHGRLFLQEDGEGGDNARLRYQDRVSKSRNREVQEHFGNGLGIHHVRNKTIHRCDHISRVQLLSWSLYGSKGKRGQR